LFSVVNVSLSDDVNFLNSPYSLKTVIEQNLNDQINQEYEAFYLYEQLAAYFSSSEKALFGFAAYFRNAADEERQHAHEFTEVLNKRMGIVTLKTVKIPLTTPVTWSSPVAALKAALEKEIEVSRSMNVMYKNAEQLNDHHMQDFLDHFVREQINAIFKLKSLITRLEGKGDAVEYLIDQELMKKPSMHD
uniref:Ferritin n=1 Tax=Mesocestoides corti TaxID=53468 RepID=A0A5K3EQC8_MESCO